MSGPALRIAAVRLEPYVLAFAQPFATATGALRERRGFVVRVQTESGAQGTGEAAPLPAFGGESLEACEAALRRWAGWLPGRSLPGWSLPRAAAGADLPPALGLVPDAADVPTALHGLELALLDLAAQAAGLPLARWLCAAAPGQVAVNATLGATAPATAAEAARVAVAAGFGTLKLKVGVGGDAADEARLRAVRAAVGPHVRLRADANGAWTRRQAAALLERWQDLALEYVEQPVAQDDLEGLAWLTAHAAVPVAADESIRTPADAQRILALQGASVLVLKPMLLGGPLTTMRIARAALAAGVAVVVTTALEGAYGRLGALHVAAAVHGMHPAAGRTAPPPACGLATGALLTGDVVPAAPGPERGSWSLPARSGLGLP